MDETKLAPGYGFVLEGDGKWDIQKIPDNIVESAKFTGYLTIQGFQCAVFEASDHSQWAQKISGTPAPKGDNDLTQMATKIANLTYN